MQTKSDEQRYKDPLNIKILYNTKGKQINNQAKIIINETATMQRQQAMA